MPIRFALDAWSGQCGAEPGHAGQEPKEQNRIQLDSNGIKLNPVIVLPIWESCNPRSQIGS